MSELSLEKVGKIYPGGVVAAADVSFTVPSGKFCVLLGPSGCGKSSILRMIAGLEGVSEGTIAIGGRVVNDMAPKDRDIAMVFQNYALYPHLTVAENIAFPLRMRGLPKDEVASKVRRAGEMMQLTELVSRRPAQLSGGQRQRVALARAIVREPKVFLFDEPLSNLDARMRDATRHELRELHQRLNVTSVYVTHDQEEAMSLADIIVVIAGGKVRQAGSPALVFDEPADRFVAGFVGTPSMNFLDVHADATGTHLDAGNGLVFASPNLSPGKPYVIGFRPTRVAVDWTGGQDGGEHVWVPAFVRQVEFLGEVAQVLFTVGQSTVVARTPMHRAAHPGERAALGLRPADVHVFEPGSFGRLLGRATARQTGNSTQRDRVKTSLTV